MFYWVSAIPLRAIYDMYFTDYLAEIFGVFLCVITLACLFVGCVSAEEAGAGSNGVCH